MRLASRFSRRLRAWAKAHQVAVSDCSAGERKHQIAAQYLLTHQVPAGLFMVLVSRAPALVWDVQMSERGKIGNSERKKPRPWINTTNGSKSECKGCSLKSASPPEDVQRQFFVDSNALSA